MKTNCKVTLIGHLGADPEIRHTPSGACVANFTVYTNERWKDRNTGEQKDRTERHRVVLFGRLAEIGRDYLRKGNPVLVEGTLQTRKWTDKEGVDRYTTEIVGNDLNLLGKASGNGAGEHPAPDAQGMPGVENDNPSFEPYNTH